MIGGLTEITQGPWDRNYVWFVIQEALYEEKYYYYIRLAGLASWWVASVRRRP